MSDLVIALTEGELSQKFNISADSPIIEFNNYQYKKGSTFSLSMRQQAITYCEKIAAEQLRSLIVEGPYSLTIWIQDKLSAVKNNQISSTASIKSAVLEPDVANDQNDGEAKKILKKYRGQTYEIDAPSADSAAKAGTNASTKKVIRQYRGQTYEVEVSETPKIPMKKIVKHYRGQTYEVEVPDYSAIKRKFSK